MCTWVTGREFGKVAEKQLSKEEICRIFETLPGNALITLSGGEPLLRPDIFEILSNGGKKFRLHLITNGTLLTASYAENVVAGAMEKMYSTGILMVGISLHGDKKIEDTISGQTGTYEKILEGIQNLVVAKNRAKRRYPLLHITTVITPENIHLLSTMFLNSEKLGVDYHNFTLQSNSEKIHSFTRLDGSGLYEFPPKQASVDSQRLRKEILEIEKIGKKSKVSARFSPLNVTSTEVVRYYENRINLSQYSCSGLWSKVIFSPYGDVYMCYRSLGNIRKDSAMEIWNSKAYRNLRKEIKTDCLQAGCTGCCFRSFNS